MKKNTLITLLALLLIPTLGYSKGKIQNEDIKSLTDITTAVLTTTGNLTSGGACIASPASVAGLATGLFIYDTTTPSKVSAGTTIAGLPGSCSAGQIQMSANATASATGDTLTFGGQASQLVNDSKIYVTALGINTTLSAAIASGTFSGATLSVATKTTTYTVTNSDNVILLDASSGAFTVTMQAVSGATIKPYRFKKIDTSMNQITIAAAGSDAIDGDASVVLGVYNQGIEMIPNTGNSTWELF